MTAVNRGNAEVEIEFRLAKLFGVFLAQRVGLGSLVFLQEQADVVCRSSESSSRRQQTGSRKGPRRIRHARIPPDYNTTSLACFQ